jgi:hypothetical protein
MVKLFFILQSKGGVGKSAYAYNLANKSIQAGVDALFLCFDNETKTSEKQLKFVSSSSYNLIDEKSKQIDRTKLDAFFEEIAEQKNYEYVFCDMGATSSEQFLKYINNDEGKIVLEALKELEIDLSIHCVVGGDNTYPACADFCDNMFEHTHGLTENVIVLNKKFEYDKRQMNDVHKLSQKYGAKITDFNIINEVGSRGVSQIHKLMELGEAAILDAPLITKKRYEASLNNMQFEFE